MSDFGRGGLVCVGCFCRGVRTEGWCYQLVASRGRGVLVSGDVTTPLRLHRRQPSAATSTGESGKG